MHPPKTINGLPYGKVAKMSYVDQVAHCGLDIPPFLIVTEADQAARRAAWAASPPRAMPIFQTPAKPTDLGTQRFLAELAAHKARTFDRTNTAAKRAAKPKPERKRDRMPEGLITAAMLGKELGVLAKLCRRYLRHAKFPKPEWGWAFTEAQAKAARKVILAGAAADKKKEKKHAKK